LHQKIKSNIFLFLFRETNKSFFNFNHLIFLRSNEIFAQCKFRYISLLVCINMLQFKFSIVASVRGGLPPQILVGFFFKRPQKKLLRKKMLQKNFTYKTDEFSLKASFFLLKKTWNLRTASFSKTNMVDFRNGWQKNETAHIKLFSLSQFKVIIRYVIFENLSIYR
jgi:hypothetical protein